MSPNLASAHGQLGQTLIFSSRPKEGLVALERGINLDPRDSRSGTRLNQVVLALYFCRDYEAAIGAGQRVIRLHPDHPPVYRWLAASLGQAGRIDEARDALAKAIAVAPASFDLYVCSRVPWCRPGRSRPYAGWFTQGRLAGLPGPVRQYHQLQRGLAPPVIPPSITSSAPVI